MQTTHCPCEGELLCISFGLSYFELFCVKNNITAPYLISCRTKRRFLEWYQWGKISTLTALDVRLVVEAFHVMERQESELKGYNNKITRFFSLGDGGFHSFSVFKNSRFLYKL